MAKTVNRVSLTALDGLCGIVVATFVLQPQLIHPQRLFLMLHSRVRASDAMFAVFFVFAWQYTFSVLHLYDRFAAMPSRLRAIAKGVLVMLVPLTLHLYFFHPTLLSIRSLTEVFIFLFLYEMNRLVFSTVIAQRIAARDPRRVLILGSGRRASMAWRELRTRYHGAINLLGFVDDRAKSEMPPDVAARFIGSVADLDDIFLERVVDVLLIAMPTRSCYTIMQEAIHRAEAAGIEVLCMQDVYTTRPRSQSLHESVFRELLPRTERHAFTLLLKRLLDIALSSVGLVILSPVFLVIAICVRLSSPGPVIFTQDRFGYRRRLFTMYKFRSMVEDAEALMPGLEAANEAVGPIFKLVKDPRVTKLGSFLRRSSLDELPQLVNVLKGDMSLVGPRPMSKRDVSLMSEAALFRRFSVRPGMTGLWQVNGRSSVGFDHWIKLDNSYIDRWSLSLDFEILARTFTVIMKRSGAV